MAPDRFECDRLASDRIASIRSAPDRFECDRLAPYRFASDKFNLLKSKFDKSASWKFKKLPEAINWLTSVLVSFFIFLFFYGLANKDYSTSIGKENMKSSGDFL